MPPAARPKPVFTRPDDPVASAILEHAAAMTGVAEALREVAGEIKAFSHQRRPMDEFFEGATMRLELLCLWLKRKGPWMLASVPVVLVAVQAISPEAGKALAGFLAGLVG